MRRKDRQITDPGAIRDIIEACDCCRVAFPTDGAPYIVPLNFGYEDGVFYFHGALAGRKYELSKAGPAVGFELDCGHALNENAEACEYSFRFQSVIGEGVLSLVTDPAEKQKGLALVMTHAAGLPDCVIPEAKLRAAAVFRLTVTDMACKFHP